MDHNKWLKMARESISGLPNNTLFVVKDLFQGAEWNALSRGDRLGFGKFFKSAVLNNNIKMVQYVGKADNNSAQYKKI